MTVLRSWGNRLFGMECLSLSFSFTLSGPAIRVRDGIKKAEVLYVWEPENRPAFLFFFLSIAPSHFLSLILSFFLKKRKRKQANEGKKGEKTMYEKETDKS